MPAGISSSQCVLCGRATESGYVDEGKKIYHFVCRLCGRYSATHRACLQIIGSNQVLYRAATRQASESNHPLLLQESDIDNLANDHEGTSVPRNLEKLTSFIARRSLRPGIMVKIDTPYDYPIIDVQSPEELNYFLKHAEEMKLLNRNGSDYSLTPAGWELTSGPTSGFIPGRCFIAMAFRPVLESAFRDGIEAAVRDDCGFDPFRMDGLEHNDKICDRIIVEIRRAQFVVADFTFQRGGVYFEAGFAAALQRPVIWTCKAYHFHRLHFDTRQYNHIKWHTPSDLRTQLAARIRGTIPGAKLT